ncbi:MAG: AtpZ/AtpI family protein [Gemmatimonadota bacterium]|nr:AtpZ/AtpI family protein [Gemmatimonadota bacterium]
MKAKDGRRRGVGESYRYVGLGWTFAMTIVLSTLAGWWLDGLIGTIPLLTVGGALVGTVLGFVYVYITVMGEADGSDDSNAQSGSER